MRNCHIAILLLLYMICFLLNHLIDDYINIAIYCYCMIYYILVIAVAGFTKTGCPFLAAVAKDLWTEYFPRIPMGHAGHAASRRDVGMVGSLQDLLSVYTLVMTFTVCHGKIHPFLRTVNRSTIYFDMGHLKTMANC